jgi:hypothetical protein
MNRARFILAAALAGASLAGPVLAQTPPAPDLKPILAGRKFTAPIRGQANVDYTKPTTRRDKDMVVTKIVVRNASDAPIPRLAIDETWYDKGGALVTGGKGVINGLLQPGEVKAVQIITPYNVKMAANNFSFAHANGTIKPTLVKALEEPKDEKK